MKLTGIFLLSIVLLIACNNKPVVTGALPILEEDTPATERNVIDTILSLPEVKERAAYIEQETKGQRHLIVLIAAEPDSTNNYYWVKAGEDNSDVFVTHFHFFVYPDSMRIMYYDVLEDAEKSLKEWRRQKSDSK